jgi:hypothetical protein
VKVPAVRSMSVAVAEDQVLGQALEEKLLGQALEKRSLGQALEKKRS